jgi:hypothetical protein
MNPEISVSHPASATMAICPFLTRIPADTKLLLFMNISSLLSYTGIFDATLCNAPVPCHILYYCKKRRNAKA